MILRSRWLIVSALLANSTLGVSSAWSRSPGCRDIAPGVASASSQSDCITVEPGAGIVIDGTLCTVGFILSGSDRSRYAVTAGHCSKGLPVGTPVLAEDGSTLIGRLAYSEHETRLAMRDTAVVRLLPKAHVRARAEVIDGPHGSFEGLTTAPFAIQHVGRGTGISLVKEDRKGVVLAATDADVLHADLALSFNDSGCPVFMTDGRALGWAVAIDSSSLYDASTSPPATAAGWIVIRIGPVLKRASKALHTKLTLVNA